MKVTFTFDSEVDGDSFKLKLHNQAEDLYFAMDEFKSYIRTQLKHGDLPEEQFAAFERVSEAFHDLLSERNVDLDLG